MSEKFSTGCPHASEGILGGRSIAYSFKGGCQFLTYLQYGLHDVFGLLANCSHMQRALVLKVGN
jgi:hypothetical protein